MRQPPRLTGSRRAFTLMEVLLATGLLAVMSVMIYRSLSAATRFYEHAGRKMEALGGQRKDRMLLARQLAGARAWPEPYTPKDPEEGRRWFFRMEAGRMDFLSPVSLARPPDGRLRLVSWQPAPDAGGGLLVEERLILGRLKAQDKDVDPDLARLLPFSLGTIEATLLAPERGMPQIAVPGINTRTGEPEWHGEWAGPGAQFLPEAVRLAWDHDREPDIWHFPLDSRHSGWPSHLPEPVKPKKNPSDPYANQPDALDVQLQEAWKGQGVNNYHTGRYETPKAPAR